MKKIILIVTSVVVFAFSASAQIAISSGTTTYSYGQDFNTLASTGTGVTWANNSTLAGWSLFNKTPAAITTYAADTGGGNGGFYSYGASGQSDRALGGTGSGGTYFGSPGTGTVAGWITVGFSNNSGGSANSFTLNYDGEQWRNGGNTTAQSMVLEYGFGSSFIGVTSWTAAGSGFNFTSPIATATAGALDGNALANRSASRGGTVSGLNWANGSTLWVRWIENNDAGNDHGLAIDNISFSSTFAAAAASYGWSGGNGTWQSGQSGNFGTTYNNNSGNTVTFSGTSGDVTVSGTVQAGSLAFTSGGYALNSGNVTVGLGAITTDTGTTTINSILEGTAGLIKSGTGALVLTGANTVAGAVSIAGGTLQIGSDGALGNAANDVANNGTLKTTSNISLGSERDITGSGSLDIGGGTTLTVNGAFNQTATTLANSGTLDLQGATRSVGNLTVNAAGTVNGSGTISATGLTTGLTSGTASINPGIVFSTGDKTLNVASGATLDLNGALSNGAGSGRIAKTGAGTLILSADNNMGGLRIGAAGSTMTDGGKVILESSVVGSQAQAIQHNFGTLEASTALVMNSGLSIGGRSNGAATLAGGDMEFQGQSTFFRGAGTIGQLALNVNNNTTLLGGLGATSGGGSSTGVTLGGSGTLNISGNSSTFTDTITTADTVKLVVNNTLGAGVNVGSGSLLSGSGKIGAITGAGTVGPGNSPGLLTATSVDPTAGTDFKFEFTALNPTYTSATASGNDLLHLTAASPFAGGTFTSGNIISIYLNSAAINNSLLAGTNTTFSGGFFVDGTYGLAAALSPASFAYYTTSAALGTGSAVDYNGISYYLLDSTIAAKTTLTDTAVASAAFSTGTVAGTVLTFNAVPEPSAQSLLAFGMAALVAVRSMRRKQS